MIKCKMFIALCPLFFTLFVFWQERFLVLCKHDELQFWTRDPKFWPNYKARRNDAQTATNVTGVEHLSFAKWNQLYNTSTEKVAAIEFIYDASSESNNPTENSAKEKIKRRNSAERVDENRWVAFDHGEKLYLESQDISKDERKIFFEYPVYGQRNFHDKDYPEYNRKAFSNTTDKAYSALWEPRESNNKIVHLNKQVRKKIVKKVNDIRRDFRANESVNLYIPRNPVNMQDHAQIRSECTGRDCIGQQKYSVEYKDYDPDDQSQLKSYKNNVEYIHGNSPVFIDSNKENANNYNILNKRAYDGEKDYDGSKDDNGNSKLQRKPDDKNRVHGDQGHWQIKNNDFEEKPRGVGVEELKYAHKQKDKRLEHGNNKWGPKQGQKSREVKSDQRWKKHQNIYNKLENGMSGEATRYVSGQRQRIPNNQETDRYNKYKPTNRGKPNKYYEKHADRNFGTSFEKSEKKHDMSRTDSRYSKITSFHSREKEQYKKEKHRPNRYKQRLNKTHYKSSRESYEHQKLREKHVKEHKVTTPKQEKIPVFINDWGPPPGEKKEKKAQKGVGKIQKHSKSSYGREQKFTGKSVRNITSKIEKGFGKEKKDVHFEKKHTSGNHQRPHPEIKPDHESSLRQRNKTPETTPSESDESVYVEDIEFTKMPIDLSAEKNQETQEEDALRTSQKNESQHKDQKSDILTLKKLTPSCIAKQLKCIRNRNAIIKQEIIGRTAEYHDIVLWKMTERKKDTKKRFRTSKINKYEDEAPQKKIIFIVHGLAVMGWSDLPCLSKVKQFKTLLSYYVNNLHLFDIFLLPMANPDGVEKEKWSLWNKNTSPQSACPGVALDRNFDVAWNISKSNVSSCNAQFPGLRPFSEKETRAIREVFHHYGHKIVGYFHVHAGQYRSMSFKGDAVLYPRGFTETQSDDDKYVDLRGEIEEVMRNASFRVISVTVDSLYNWYGSVAGTSVDYAATVYGIPFALELVMQLYEDNPWVEKEEDREQHSALTAIWKPLINVIFESIHNNIERKKDDW